MLTCNKDGRSNATRGLATTASDDGYKVGPGRPPREFQFKPGQSGNPKGAKRKPRSIAVDIKELLEHALGKNVTIKRADKEQIVSMAAAGIEQLVAQYAKGDRHARRDVFWLAEKYGVDLVTGEHRGETPLPENLEQILNTFVDRQYNKVRQPSPVLAPPELLDDDVQGEKQP
jgi:hypothetical protein